VKKTLHGRKIDIFSYLSPAIQLPPIGATVQAALETISIKTSVRTEKNKPHVTFTTHGSTCSIPRNITVQAAPSRLNWRTTELKTHTMPLRHESDRALDRC
jgi:hypothetical protein